MNQAAATAFPVLRAAGIQAGRIAGLWWIFFALLIAVYLLVLVALVVALARRRSGPGGDERRAGRVVSIAVGATVVVLLALLGGSIATGRGLEMLGEAGDPLTVEVIGHQWWWELHYQDQDPSQMVIGANELHLPVGRSVQLKLKSQDVIHSFWVPALHGKRDLIPGYTNVITLRADRPGVYAGRCAEFCGLQHANMALTVVADEPAAFQAWLTAQRAPAAAPATAAATHGREVFLQSACPLCHNVMGTDAFGMLAPDLTHVGSRRAIAAGALHNDPAALERWLHDPQVVKPGNQMPIVPLPDADRRDLVAFLEGLK
jgi:cytochrome c oxidase subunit II